MVDTETTADTPNYQMTRSGVLFTVDVDKNEMIVIGSPSDWDWKQIVEEGLGQSVFTKVRTKSVLVESRFTINDAGEEVHETTHSLVEDDLEKSFDKILGYAEEHIVNNQYDRYCDVNTGKSVRVFSSDLTDLSKVRDFVRNHFGNPHFENSKIDNILKDLPIDKD